MASVANLAMLALTLLGLLGCGAAQDTSYEGVVLHGMPHLYEADNITLKAGVTLKPLRLMTNRPESGAVGDAMGRLVPILRQAVQQINENTTLLPDYVVELYLSDSLCANHKASQSSMRLIWDHKDEEGFFKMQFGPLCSGPTGAVNDMIQVFNMFQVATISRGAFLSDGSRYPYLCRLSPSLQFVADGITQMVMLFGWRQVGAVQDTRGLSASTVTEFKAAVKKASAGGYFDFAPNFTYGFDQDFLAANHFTIDGKNFNEEDIAKTFKAKGVKIALIALYEDVGAPFYCHLYKQGYSGVNGMTTILALSWWGDSWIAEQVEEQTAAYNAGTRAQPPPCTAAEIYNSAQYMFSMGQTAFLQSNKKHEITGAPLIDIYNTYLADCTADDAEGCHFDFAAYDYDGLTMVAKAFHTWIYDQGHELTEIDYLNPNPKQELHAIVESMSFLGVSGNVAFFDQIELDCERKGTFSLRQLLNLAIAKGENGWSDVASFTSDGGFATVVQWNDMMWPDGTKTTMGDQNEGFPNPPNAPGGVTRFFGGGSGFENVPVDVTTCPVGEQSGSTGCEKCPAGTSGDGSGACASCARGKFSPEGAVNCETCPRGQYQNYTGRSFCNDCKSGTISSEAEPWLCMPCPAGQSQPVEGQSECVRCGLGFYQPDEGTAVCVPCPSERTTKFISALSVGDCVCSERTYEPFPLDADIYKCLPCPVGMNCQEGSRLADWVNGNLEGTYPRLLEQYYSTSDEPVYVYKCLDERNCPGGDPGICAEKRQGFSCGRCEVGYYSFGGECNKCNSIELTTAIFPTVPLIAGPMLTVFIYTRLLEPMRIRWMDGAKNRALALIFFYIVHFQTLGIIRQFNLVFPQLVTVPWEFMGLVNSGVQFLRPECASGGSYSNFSVQFSLRTLLPLVIGLYFLFAYLIFKYIVTKISAHLKFGIATEGKQRSALIRVFTQGMDLDSTINTFGTVLYTFSIAVLAIAFDLFKCFPHPNGLSSLRVSADVLCYKTDWNQMLVVGILAILVYFVASYSLFGWVCFVAPTRFHDPGFRRRWKFLFIKWSPSRWWFGQIFLMKGVFLNLTLVCFQGGALQVMWTGLTLMVYMSCVLVLNPWRHFACNLLDSVVSYSLLCISMISVYFALDSEDADKTLDKVLVVFTFIPIISTTLGIAYYISMWLRKPRWELSDSIKTALEVDSLLIELTKQGTMGLIHGIMQTSLSDRTVAIDSLYRILSETCSKQIPGYPRLIQRESQYDQPGRLNSHEQDVPRESKRLTFQDEKGKFANAIAKHHEAFAAWCKKCPDVAAEVGRIFKDKHELSQDEFIDAFGANDQVAPYAAAFCDCYEEDTVPREVFEAFLTFAKQHTQMDVTQLYSRSMTWQDSISEEKKENVLKTKEEWV